MRNLWRNTAYLFWQYPILWLPVVLADVIAYCLRTFQSWMQHAVIQSLVEGHSVLSSSPEPVSTLPVTWAIIFAASKLMVELVNLYLYAAAMIALSILIPALVARMKMPWQQILPVVKQSCVRILLFSLKLFGMILVASFLDVELVMYLPRLHFLPLSMAVPSRDQNIALVALFFAAVAWLLAPSAVALLRPRGSPPAENLRHARNFAAVCVLTSVAIYLFAQVEKASFAPLLTSVFRGNLFWGVLSVISAIPYVPLFIAIYLIATPGSPLAIPPPANTESVDSASDDIPE
jgi:hypothetical protein